jgi:chorismate-pyruvate lyase
MLRPNDGWDLAHALSERILAASSATFELERWCMERGIGDGRIVAVRNRAARAKTLDDGSREAAYPRSYAENRFRRVKLATSGIAVVDALNWYFPSRLTGEMRELLDTTDVAFGRAIAALDPRRRTFLVRHRTREQLAEARRSQDMARTIFEHRALVLGSDGALLAVVHERFCAALLFA